MENPSSAVSRSSALLVSLAASFVTPFMGSSVAIALPSIARDLGANATLLTWVGTSYLLAAAMCLVPFGRIADVYGRKRVFTVGMIVYTLSSLLSALARTPMELVLYRLIEGVGGAMIFGTGVAILISVYPPQERGRVLGINVAAVYAGLSLGPVIGGFLTHRFGWRSVFLSVVPLGTFAVVLIFLRLKGEWAEAKEERLDPPGSLLYALSLVALMYGLSKLPSLAGAALILAGFAGLVGFVFYEMSAASPMLDIRLFRENVVFALSNVAAFVNYSATFATGFLLSLFLQYVKGFDAQSAGTIMAMQPVVMACLSPVAGRLSDRIEPRLVATGGMVFTVLGLGSLVFLGAHTSLGFVLVSLVLLGFGFAFFSSPNTNAVMSSVDRRSYGIASATLGTMRLTGQMFSMGIVMLIFSLYLGPAKITSEHYPLFLKSARLAFGVFTGLCVAGVFASLARGRVHRSS